MLMAMKVEACCCSTRGGWRGRASPPFAAFFDGDGRLVRVAGLPWRAMRTASQPRLELGQRGPPGHVVARQHGGAALVVGGEEVAGPAHAQKADAAPMSELEELGARAPRRPGTGHGRDRSPGRDLVQVSVSSVWNRRAAALLWQGRRRNRQQRYLRAEDTARGGETPAGSRRNSPAAGGARGRASSCTESAAPSQCKLKRLGRQQNDHEDRQRHEHGGDRQRLREWALAVLGGAPDDRADAHEEQLQGRDHREGRAPRSWSPRIHAARGTPSLHVRTASSGTASG